MVSRLMKELVDYRRGPSRLGKWGSRLIRLRFRELRFTGKVSRLGKWGSRLIEGSSRLMKGSSRLIECKTESRINFENLIYKYKLTKSWRGKLLAKRSGRSSQGDGVMEVVIEVDDEEEGGSFGGVVVVSMEMEKEEDEGKEFGEVVVVVVVVEMKKELVKVKALVKW